MPTGFASLDDGSLPPGDYAAIGFEVPLTFSIPDRFGETEWTVFETQLHTFVALGHGEGLGMTFMVPSVAFDPIDETAEAAPADWTMWLTTHPRLEVTAQGDGRVGDLPAEWLDVAATDEPDNDICGAGGLDGVRIASTDELRAPVVGAVCAGFPKRIYLLTVLGKQLLIFIDGEILDDSEEVLETVAFLD